MWGTVHSQPPRIQQLFSGSWARDGRRSVQVYVLIHMLRQIEALKRYRQAPHSTAELTAGCGGQSIIPETPKLHHGTSRRGDRGEIDPTEPVATVEQLASEIRRHRGSTEPRKGSPGQPRFSPSASVLRLKPTTSTCQLSTDDYVPASATKSHYGLRPQDSGTRLELVDHRHAVQRSRCHTRRRNTRQGSRPNNTPRSSLSSLLQLPIQRPARELVRTPALNAVRRVPQDTLKQLLDSRRLRVDSSPHNGQIRHVSQMWAQSLKSPEMRGASHQLTVRKCANHVRHLWVTMQDSMPAATVRVVRNVELVRCPLRLKGKSSPIGVFVRRVARGVVLRFFQVAIPGDLIRSAHVGKPIAHVGKWEIIDTR
jgi:hypothetical protein